MSVTDWLRQARDSYRERKKGWVSPESRCVVHVTEDGAMCTDRDGEVTSVSWEDLRSVEVVTNDSGPWGMDVWWVLRSPKAECAVPQGAVGELSLINRLQSLPGFDNRALVEAVGCTGNGRFLCWRKEG